MTIGAIAATSVALLVLHLVHTASIYLPTEVCTVTNNGRVTQCETTTLVEYTGHRVVGWHVALAVMGCWPVLLIGYFLVDRWLSISKTNNTLVIEDNNSNSINDKMSMWLALVAGLHSLESCLSARMLLAYSTAMYGNGYAMQQVPPHWLLALVVGVICYWWWLIFAVFVGVSLIVGYLIYATLHCVRLDHSPHHGQQQHASLDDNQIGYLGMAVTLLSAILTVCVLVYAPATVCWQGRCAEMTIPQMFGDTYNHVAIIPLVFSALGPSLSVLAAIVLVTANCLGRRPTEAAFWRDALRTGTIFGYILAVCSNTILLLAEAPKIWANWEQRGIKWAELPNQWLAAGALIALLSALPLLPYITVCLVVYVLQCWVEMFCGGPARRSVHSRSSSQQTMTYEQQQAYLVRQMLATPPRESTGNAITTTTSNNDNNNSVDNVDNNNNTNAAAEAAAAQAKADHLQLYMPD